MTAYQMFINGKFVNARSGKTFNVFDPATEGVLATCPAGEAADVADAVAAAKAAFYGGWKATSAQERGRVLFRIAERIRARRDELARIETLNSGKPIVESEYDMDDSAVCFEYYGGLATKINGEVIPVPTNAMVMAVKEPMGVAGQIIPWNYPLAMAAWKLGPAIAAGCTVVIKPAEQTPLSLLELAKDFEACGLPPGVINIVTGMGPECGGPIVAHPDVRKIAFTGSAEVGKIIMRSAADQLKRVSLELGGKSPNIFFSDSDFEAAVDGALFGVFINQGEVCSAGSRVLVQQDIYKKFVDACAAKAKTIRVGPGIDRETKMGPLVSAEQRDRVKGYLDIGKKEAKVAAGGGTPKQHSKGWYVEPTIFYDVDNGARIAQEEIFGPVMSVIPFKDEAHALEIANATPYGLAAAVWTRDIFKAFRVTRALEAGIVWVNHMQPTMLEAPWGGYKMSGFGRELGHWGVEEYLETKQIYINLDEAPIAWY
ncbi:MAG: aldehyde dehydrogenase family protein [Gemmatimonadales bacterium]|nr:aldehyde dehydrogenase family protein [Gemmatimonadales bacterium]MBP9199571.1 aldehyde dehydrogenase family protein [Gemmatimonadales bacterium]